MSLSSPNVPTAPLVPAGQNALIDPYQLAATQQGYNTAAGIMNQAGSMMPMSTPGYTQNYQQIGTGPGGVPIYGISQQLTGANQNLYNQYQTNQAHATEMLNFLTGRGADWSNQVSPNLGQASGLLGQGAGQVAGASNLIAPGVNNLQMARLLQDYYSNPAGHQAQGFANQYGAQNPNQIGDMASGLTGQRMESAVAGIRPFQIQQRNALDNQLRNQGLHPGMPGYDTAMRELDNSQNMAISSFQAQFQPQAWQQATQIYQDPLAKQAAQQQAAEMYGNMVNRYLGQAQGYGGLAGQQAGLGAQFGALGNAATNLGQTWGNLGANYMSQGLPWLAASAPTLPPVAQSVPLNIAPTNVANLGSAYNQQLGSNYSNQLAAYQAAQQNQQNMLSGLFGLGSTALGGLAMGGFFSDRRLKENITPLGTLPNGIPVYRFNYVGSGPTMIGPMADEVEKVMPEAVIYADGYALVDYERVMS